jgi:hypothetical protein
MALALFVNKEDAGKDILPFATGFASGLVTALFGTTKHEGT